MKNNHTIRGLARVCNVSINTMIKYRDGKPVSPVTLRKIGKGFNSELENFKADIEAIKLLMVTTYEAVDINKPLPTIDQCEVKYLAVQDAFRHVENVRRKEAQHIKGTHAEKEIMTLAEASPAVNEAKLNFITVLNREI